MLVECSGDSPHDALSMKRRGSSRSYCVDHTTHTLEPPRARRAMPAWPEYGAHVPLWDAVYKQDSATVQKILGSVAGPKQVNAPHGMWQQTSVHLAVRKGNAKMLKALLFTGGDANGRMINGTTPLHLAVEMKRKDMIKDLLLVGADPVLRDHTNKTALMMARDLQLWDVVSWLEQAATSLPVQRELKRQQEAEDKKLQALQTTAPS